MGHALAVEMRRAVKLLIRSTCSRDRPGPVRVVDKSYWRHEANGVTGQTTPHQSQPNYDRSGRGVTITDGVMAGTGARRKPQKYPEELRERAVRMVFEVRERTGEKHGVITRVARELGIGTESLRGWVRQAEIDTGRRAGTSTADAERIAALEKEVRELRRANDILKAASVFFATELDGRPKK